MGHNFAMPHGNVYGGSMTSGASYIAGDAQLPRFAQESAAYFLNNVDNWGCLFD